MEKGGESMIQADIQGFCGGLETFDKEGPDRV